MPSNKKLLQAAAGNAGDPLYAEDVFSTYLYDGNSSTNVITNGIDLAGEGGLVWGKSRNNAFGHMLIDTVRGGDKGLVSNATSAEYDNNTMITSFNSNGFTLGSYLGLNYNGDDVASWSFRKAEKFFDVQTYTGNGTAGRTIAHNLGAVPGMMVIKNLTDGTKNWEVWHRVDGVTAVALRLNLTSASSAPGAFNNTDPTSTVFTLATDHVVNKIGDNYVAYLFASDAGGFGDDSDENIIKCGSYTGNGNVTGPLINLGFEPQFVLIKAASRTGHWFLLDVLRGISTGPSSSSPGTNQYLLANSYGAEGETTSINVNSTGFQPRTTDDSVNENNATYIYMAIRRPMKTPEAGTEVYTPLAYTGNSTANRILTSSNNPVDLGIVKQTVQGNDWIWTDRLRGAGQTIYSNYTQADDAQSTYISGLDVQSGIEIGSGNPVNNNTKTYISYMLSRATGFIGCGCLYW